MTIITPIPFAPPRPLNAGSPFIFGFGGGVEPSEWCVEAKLAGERVLIHRETGEIFNRRMTVYSKEHRIRKAVDVLLARLQPHATKLAPGTMDPLFEWIDAEALTCQGNSLGEGSVSVIDVDAPGDLVERRALFEHLATFPLTGKAKNDSVYKMPRFPMSKALWLWNKTKGLDSLFEGVVMKRLNSPYTKEFHSTTKETTNWMKSRWA